MIEEKTDAGLSFAELDLAPEVLQAVRDAGYTHPTPIQQQAIPLALAGRDLIGLAQTGTGKTAGFTLPIVHNLISAPITDAKGEPLTEFVFSFSRPRASWPPRWRKAFENTANTPSSVWFRYSAVSASSRKQRRFAAEWM